MLRRASQLLAVCVIFFIVVGVHASAPDGASAQEEDGERRLRVALNGYENNLTPFTLTFGSAPNTHDLIMLVYDSLFWSQAKENPEPWLAQKATPSDGGRVWTVTLREGLTWHDGEPLTAEDVKFSFDYYERFAASSGRYAHHVFDVPPFEGAEVVDERTVRLTYAEPAPTFKILPGADLPIIPKHVWEDVDEPIKETESLPVGSGPFEVANIAPDQSYRLRANEDYFKGRPTVDELELNIVEDPAAAFSSLRTGEVDMVTRNVPPELVDQFSGDSGSKVAEGTKFESLQMYFNAQKAPLSDAKLRKAISLAIDSQALVDTVLLGQGRPGRDEFIHPDSPWASPEGGHEFDPERVREMLDEAGYSEGPDGVRRAPDGEALEFTVLVSSFEPQSIRAVQLVAQQVEKVGVKFTAETLDPATLRERRAVEEEGEVPDYDAYVSVLEAHAHVDPDSLYYFFHSPGEEKGFGDQITGYSNPEFDALSEEAATSEVPDRKPLLNEMQGILAEEAPAIVLYYPDGRYAYRPEAYAGWVSDFGHGIFTKRSFLQEYVRGSDNGASGDEGSGSNLLAWGVGGGAVVALAAVVLLLRRRGTAEDDMV